MPNQQDRNFNANQKPQQKSGQRSDQPEGQNSFRSGDRSEQDMRRGTDSSRSQDSKQAPHSGIKRDQV